MRKHYVLLAFISIFFGIFQMVKADTLYFQAPQSPQHLCVDINNLPTLIIYKPNGFGSTVWFVNGTYYGTGDSIIYTPNAVGSYNFGANWNGNVEGIIIRLYSQPPAHAQFTLPYGGGSVSATNDTVYMCGNSVIVSATGSIYGETYMLWTGPGGFVSNLAPVDLSLPGMYIFERGNPCGVTRDTFYLFKVASQLPAALTAQAVFCNQPVNTTLDAGPGWLSYQWSTGANTQTISVTAPGTYTVTVNNFGKCGVGQLSKMVTIQDYYYPLPDLYAYSTPYIMNPLCGNQNATLIPHDSYQYDQYQWYKGSSFNDFSTPVGHSPTLTVTAVMGGGYYHVITTVGNGCKDTATGYLYFIPLPPAPDHCVSTYDITTGKNKTVFGIQASPDYVQHILTFKMGNQWVELARVDADPGFGYHVYTLWDTIHNPNQQSIAYAVFTQHLCGAWSLVGDWHKTIRIGIFQDVITGDFILTLLDNYTTMSGFLPEYYTIYIDSLNNGNLQSIGILYGGNNSFTLTPVQGAAYYAAASLPWDCIGSKPTLEAYSNKRTFTTSDVEVKDMGRLEVMPNPSSGMYVLSVPVERVEIYDMMGRQVKQTGKTSHIDITDLPSGVYMARITGKLGSVTRKLVKE